MGGRGGFGPQVDKGGVLLSCIFLIPTPCPALFSVRYQGSSDNTTTLIDRAISTARYLKFYYKAYKTKTKTI